MSFTAEELEWRRAHLGASEIAAVAEISPFASPITVWESKVLGVDFLGNEATEIGELCEPIAAELYARRTQRALKLSKSLEHPLHRWASATPDRIVDGEPILVECKTVGVNAANEWGDEDDAIPDWYRAQVEWQMEVAGVARCDVAALIGTSFRIYRIDRDPALAAALLDRGRAFWHDYVLRRVPPPIDGSDDARAFLHRRHPHEREGMREMPITAIPWVTEWREAKEMRKLADARIAQATNVLKSVIGDGEGIFDESIGRVTWTRNETDGVAWESLATHLMSFLDAKQASKLIDRFTVRPGPRVLREFQPSKSSSKKKRRARSADRDAA